MNSFQFRSGNAELLPYCECLWDSFIETQTKNAGIISAGITDYIQGLLHGGLLAKSVKKLHVQLVDLGNINEPIGFCITSLSSENIGEVEALYIVEKYQGKHLGTQLMKTTLQWMTENNVVEKKLRVVIGNEAVFSFYQKFGFYPVCTTLFGS